MEGLNGQKRQVECAIPILPVRNLKASIDFFLNRLGFQLDWSDAEQDAICSVSRDRSRIMLMRKGAEFAPAWVWIGLEDDSLFDEFRANGVEVLQEPKNYSWAYEIKFTDIDGNVLWLGTEPKTEIPFEDKG